MTTAVGKDCFVQTHGTRSFKMTSLIIPIAHDVAGRNEPVGNEHAGYARSPAAMHAEHHHGCTCLMDHVGAP